MTEQSIPAVAAMEEEHALALKFSNSQRLNVEAGTEASLGLRDLYKARAHLRNVFAGCASFAIVLAIGWSVFLWVRWS